MRWRVVSVVMFLVAIGLLAWAYPRLPTPMATKFTMAGEPLRWSSPGSFVLTVTVIAALINLAFLGGIPWLLERIGSTRFNVPNRDYWLSTPERRAEALRRLGPFLARSAVFANGVLLLSLHLVTQWNGLPVTFPIPASWTGPLLLGTVLGGVLVLLVWAFWDFRIPEPEHSRGRPG
ncbi:MAG: DUF1648 domain-containing protein [Gemmatimonadota bacterium]